ncbi:glycosyltransferase family 2 protein [Microbacterium yannicii]|uniref:glycosyltransferase family 2 protein n=1 Tax=Microbacterium yannicii TaxID=671622 RepID=UPI0003631ECA|nr:glycosyltransferase family 2 protein [Microbacterium yannicii]
MNAPAPLRRFVVDEGRADVVVIIVTFNSAGEIDGLIDSLRHEGSDAALRVVVADNSSSDDTLARLRAHPDITVVETGGNLGYAGGINVAAARVGTARAQLVLNPDLRVARGSVRAMLDALAANPGAGAIAPRIVGEDGALAMSLHNEPGVVRAVADAALGPIWRRRPRMLSEWVRNPTAYDSPRRTDWATGAALLISSDAAELVGEWDERFFLYSEETDYCRRIRDAGFDVWYEPGATVQHSQGASGSSPQLDALLQVNRLRYMRKHAPRRAGAYRWAALLGAALRSARSEAHRLAAAMLRDETRWRELPSAQAAPS